ncbi:MAG: alpha/beta hydrolase [Turicibacter sp.]|nr:alpha/beta hydrolase [Turicibacter sp.]
MRQKKHFVIWGISAILILFFVPMMISLMMYEHQFGNRHETPSYLKYDLSEFQNLEQTPAHFKSNKGQILSGYLYRHSDVFQPQGIIILAHGFGVGHNTYLPEIDFMAQNGYIVFAYDGTGNDESEGESIVGLPQAVIDLDYAINNIKNDEEFEDLPIMLYGHSIGGYAVINVLSQHPDITAVVERSGFYESAELICQIGTQKVGPLFKVLSPYIRLYEQLKFGGYANLNGLDILAQTEVKVMFMHSEDDEVISYDQSFAKYQSLFNTRSNFQFISYQDRGHDVVVDTQLNKLLQIQLREDYKLYQELPDDIKMMYDEVLYDRDERLDVSVMQDVIDFYNQSIIREYE